MSLTSPVAPNLGELCCPLCRWSFSEFRRSGRLGCPQDYDLFLSRFVTILQQHHGATRHVGKRPRQRVDQRARTRLSHRAHLRWAIAEENYELAARYRDLLRQEDASS